MKKIIATCLFWALFGSGILHAQAILSVVPGSVKITPDTFAVGDRISINLTLKNIGTAAFTDPSINIYYKTSADTVPSILTTLNVIDTISNGLDIAVGKTVAVKRILLIADAIYFPPSDTVHNIIVVWPTGLENNGQPDPNVKYAIDSTPVKYVDTSGKITTALFVPANKGSEDIILIYPNPAVDEFNIEALINGATIKNVKIIDIAGKQMTDWELSGNRVNFAGMPNGVYLISVTLSDGNVAKYKIIKE